MKTTKYDRHKSRRSYKSEMQQTRVLAKKIAGATITEIAKSEGIARPTVRKILSDKQYQEIVKEHRQTVLDLIPNSIRAYRTALDGVDVPEGVAPKSEKIEVLDGDELKRRMDQAYRKGLAAGMDAVKVATEVLKGTQVLVTKRDLNAKVEDEDLSKLSKEELCAELAKELQALVDQGRLQPPL
jgi:predicted transcriptional regulator